MISYLHNLFLYIFLLYSVCFFSLHVRLYLINSLLEIIFRIYNDYYQDKSEIYIYIYLIKIIRNNQCSEYLICLSSYLECLKQERYDLKLLSQIFG